MKVIQYYFIIRNKLECLCETKKKKKKKKKDKENDVLSSSKKTAVTKLTNHLTVGCFVILKRSRNLIFGRTWAKAIQFRESHCVRKDYQITKEALKYRVE